MSWHCPLPYKSISSNPQGYYALCCESDISPHHSTEMTLSEFRNSEYMKKIKEGFKLEDPLLVPEIHKACYQCKYKEDQGGFSKRQRELTYERYQETFIEFKLIGNICNYACLMCHPLSSSKIAEERGIDLPKYFNFEDDWYDDLKELSKDYSYYKFSGGEPFMSPTTSKIIRALIDTGRSHEIKLQFNTNGSASKKVVQKLLDNFREVNICFSIDAWGERNSIIRKHSTWEFTEDRLWDYSSLLYKNEHMSLNVHPCISILNIGYLNDFEPYIKQFYGNKRFCFSVSNTLAYPYHFNAAYMPYDIKQMYLEKNYDFLMSDECDKPQSTIGILEADNVDIRYFREGIHKIPYYEKWYPEFTKYA